MKDQSAKIEWRFITKNQKRLDKAEGLARIILADLHDSSILAIEKYPKYKNSYSIRIHTHLPTRDFNTAVLQCLRLSSKICRGWSVYYDEEARSFGLLFNKPDGCRTGKIPYNVITWIFCEINFELIE